MDYKELIEVLRGNRRVFDILEYLEDAATAIETLLAERDAVLEDLRGDCRSCVHEAVGLDDYPCNVCIGDCNWQWRGPIPPDREEIRDEFDCSG